MQITIELPEGLTSIQQMAAKEALQTIASKATVSNIQFMAELAQKPGINEKLEKKKGMIRRNI